MSTDVTRYLPESEIRPSAEPGLQPSPAPSFVTAEEKLAFIRSEPVPQPEGCVAPEGGWKSMGHLGLFAASAYQAAHADTVIGNGQTFVDHDGTQIALITITKDADEEAVSQAISEMYPDAFCVRRSQLTREDLDRVEDDPVLNDSTTVLSSDLWIPDQGPSDDPVPVFTATTRVLTEELVERAAQYPAGLVELVPWFEPVVDVSGR